MAILMMSNVEDMAHLFDRYGVSIGMLTLFIIGGAYILRRLFNQKDGLFTNYVKNTTEQQNRLAATIEKQADTDVSLTRVLEGVSARLVVIEKIVDRVDQIHHDPGSLVSTITLQRCFLHGCDVIEAMAEKLDMEERTRPLINIMRRELDKQSQSYNPQNYQTQAPDGPLN